MRMNKLICLLLVALLAPLAANAQNRRGGREGGDAGRAAQGHATSVRAILIIASKEPGRTDPRLAAYEGILRSNLRFESFRYVSEGSTTVGPGEHKTLSVQGNSVEVANEGGTVVASRGGRGLPVPIVLLGGSAGGKGDVYGIIVVAQ